MRGSNDVVLIGPEVPEVLKVRFNGCTVLNVQNRTPGTSGTPGTS